MEYFNTDLSGNSTEVARWGSYCSLHGYTEGVEELLSDIINLVPHNYLRVE